MLTERSRKQSRLECVVLLRTVFKYNRMRYLPIVKGRRIVKIPRPFFLASTASVYTQANIVSLSIILFIFRLQLKSP